MRKISKLNSNLVELPKRKRVCAYARVSCEKDMALHSLSAQIDEYAKIIKANPEWEFAGVFADEALTGTKDNRDEFQAMLAECYNGEIDIILTKSISRFARNTVDLLETVRKLKNIGVEVRFEREKINSLTADGELMLSILASYAQEESRSASENVKWRIRADFKEGKYNNFNTFGYDKNLHIVPREAKIVKQIFKLYLLGDGVYKIADNLGLSKSQVRYVLSNERYVGDLLLQKTYTTDHISKRCVMNRGEVEQYFVADNHEPIISREDFDKAQAILEARAERFKGNRPEFDNILKGKIICGYCGTPFQRKWGYKKPYWLCGKMSRNYKSCPNKQIREDILLDLVGDIEVHNIKVFADKIIINDKHERLWQNRSRKDSWTDEMKQKARESSCKRK